MMMRAVEAGGIPAVYSRTRDREVRANSSAVPGYDPNPHGFYELDDFRGLDWSALRGKVVKIIRDNLDFLPTRERLVAVYMIRNPAEIAASFPGTMSGPCTPANLHFLHGYDATVRADVARLGRMGATVTMLHYAQVVADPTRELSKLGWPMDVALAAATVDPKLYRHRVVA